jgi:hypothetical protein
MAEVSIRQKLRPVRFAFLVNHRNTEELRTAIRINTVLWGGMFNAIIPVFKRTPASWRTSWPAKSIVRGYLEAFEPDLVVVGSGIDATAYGVKESSASPLDAMLTSSGLAERGTHVMSVYRWLYKRRFRFVHREPPSIHLARASSVEWEGLAAAVFGEFPPAPLGVFEESFLALGAEEVELTPESFRAMLRKGLSPLLMANQCLRPGSPGPNRSFVLLDPTQPQDLIDFWNLRAMGWRTLAVPVPWAKVLGPSIAKTIAEQHRPQQHLLPRFTRAHIFKARSVTDASFAKFVHDLQCEPETTEVAPAMPTLWDPAARSAAWITRVELTTGWQDSKAELRDDTVSFKVPKPKFVKRGWGRDGPHFACVIEFRSESAPTLASVIPVEISDLDSLLQWYGRPNMIRNTSEGLTLLAGQANLGAVWRAPFGLRIFKEWLKPRGEVALSGAGKIANGVISLVGGPRWVRLIDSIDLVKLIASAAESSSRDIPHSKLLATLLQVHKNNREWAERRIEGLVRQKVLRFGIRLQCALCAQQNWFALESLREDMHCEQCLEGLPFPTAMPPKQPCWSYRPLGPFAAKGYAQGTYVVAAAIRMLRDLGAFARTTWIPSFTLTNAERVLEADFAVLLADDHHVRRAPWLILGECKTFDKFRAVDVQRMKHLAKTFPGAVLVFATFNDVLSKPERDIIGALATWGRVRWRNPVMVLTARELTADISMPYCWMHSRDSNEKRMYDATAGAGPGTAGLLRLSDATQQLRLDLAPGPGWPHADED